MVDIIIFLKDIFSLPKSHIIAVTGGSCSGKTTIVKKLCSQLGEERCSVVFQDSYYLGLSCITNFDHPSAIDFTLMRDHLTQLKEGIAIDMPSYDFHTHKRRQERTYLEPTPIVLVDGILILASEILRDIFDLKVFVECDEALRRERRTDRDVADRGRKYEETLEQFDKQVVPAHNLFVEPSKQYADYICKQSQALHSESFLTILRNHCETIINKTSL